MRKVLIIDLHCDALLPAGVGEFGGGNTYSKSLLSTIMNTDVEFMYITRKKISSLSDSENIASNIKYFRIHISQKEVEDKDTLFLHTDELKEQIIQLLDQYSFVPDLIHSIYWPCGIIARQLSIYFSIPMIHTVLSNGRRKKIQSGDYKISNERISAEQESFEHAKYIICSSNYELKDIKELYHIPESKLILTGLDVDVAFKVPAYDRSGKYQLSKLDTETSQYITIDKASHFEESFWWNNGAFLYYGRLHPDKGILEIIKCWLELKQQYSDFPPLWIAGGTPEQIYKVRKQIGFEKQLMRFETSFDLVWWGRLTPNGLSTLMLKTLALVSHSRYESGGLMVLESMAHKIPVIATPHGYAKDYIRDWKNGFLIPFNDLTMLKRRLIHFYKQPFLSSALGENAGNLYKGIHRFFAFSEKHMSLYRGNKLLLSAEHFDTNTAVETLPYPMINTTPSDNEILSFFSGFIQQLTWNYNTLPILRLSNDTLQYHRWILEWNQEFYECFVWKSYINPDKVFFDTEPSFYIQDRLFKTDRTLYTYGYLKTLNPLDDCQVYIYKVENCDVFWNEIQNNFQKLFCISKEHFPDLIIIDFEQFAKESKKALNDYYYTNCDFLKNVYSYLEKAQLQSENMGIVPLFLTKHTIIDNHFRHIGLLGHGPKSYFYAQYILQYQIYDFRHMIESEDIYRNTLYWMLNFQYRDAVKDLIKHNSISKNIINTIQRLIVFLK